MDQRQRAHRGPPRRRRRAPRSGPPRGRQHGSHGAGRRPARPPPARGPARRPPAHGRPAAACTGRHQRRSRAGAGDGARSGPPARPARAPWHRTAPRRRRTPGPPPPAARPAAASGASPARASASPHSSRITSRRRASHRLAAQHGDALGHLQRVAGGAAEALAHVGDQGDRGRPAPRATATMLRASARACSSVGMKAPEPHLHVHHQRLQARRRASWPGSRR